jgi:hypothetical protein
MMIKKKAKDTTRKNVARSSAIMMTHLLCWPGWFFLPASGPADATKIPLKVPSTMGEFYPPHITRPLQVGYESVTFPAR